MSRYFEPTVAAADQFVTAHEHRSFDVLNDHLNRVGAHRARPSQRTPHLCLEPLEPVILVPEDRVGLPRNLDQVVSAHIGLRSLVEECSYPVWGDRIWCS
jgi:hypothetical protein